MTVSLSALSLARRREFLGALGGAAAWPLAAQGQQPAIPVIGFLGTTTPKLYAYVLTAFRQRDFKA
jgi:putative ABC transport system substrate-binding protein